MRIRRLTAAVATVLLTVTGATTAAATHQPKPKPTIVLVHGAFADAGSWSEVTKKLQRDGYTVVSPAVPLRSVATDTAYLNGVLAGIPGPKVLVGHSYGGAVITELAGAADVKSLVYVAAFIPQAGETLGALNSQFPGSEIGPDTTNAITYPGGVDLVMKPDAFRWVFAADLPTRQAAVLASSQRPVSASVFTETILKSAPAGLPKYAVIPGKDRAIAPAAEQFMAKRAGAKIVNAPGASHLVMLSEPSLVTRTIEQAAR
ncbi:alpha/beta hydrolase [Kribbella antibiotica]|uniref:Alpha/beta hydrolase n=1 Tax=Kribbella antibiotica TaxID=190195 RepID=A0A4R4ZJY2_9ACTN|nr:alpha/beta hydrolase [Kribbella antibiotica]TDD58346.1 alpha/beta hydrolase [Kribbella antibiotica]